MTLTILLNISHVSGGGCFNEIIMVLLNSNEEERVGIASGSGVRNKAHSSPQNLNDKKTTKKNERQ